MRDVDGLILSKQDVSQGFERYEIEKEKSRQYKESKYHRSVQNENSFEIFQKNQYNAYF